MRSLLSYFFRTASRAIREAVLRVSDIPMQDRFTEGFFRVDLEGLLDIGVGIDLDGVADEAAEVHRDLRIVAVELYRAAEVRLSRAAGAEEAQTFLEDHAGVDVDRVFADAEDRDSSLGTDQIDDLLDRDRRAVAADALKGVVEDQIVGDVGSQIRAVGKGEVGELLAANAENMDAAFGEHLLEQERGDERKVAVAPDANMIASLMSNLLKAGDRMDADADQLGERRYVGVESLGEQYQTLGLDTDVFLQKSVGGAAAEFACAQIVFGDIGVVLTGDIRDHDDTVAGVEAAAPVIHDLTDPLVDQRHRELFPENADVARTLIVALVGVADR